MPHRFQCYKYFFDERRVFRLYTAEKTKIMKIIVFSDSHGRSLNMEKVIQSHYNADYFFHLGDGISEFNVLSEKYSDKAFVCVEGNMDLFSFHKNKAVTETTLDIDGYRIFMTHGHKYGVKRDLDELIYAGRQRKADLVLYGHTHIPYSDYLDFEDKPLRILCPGSIERPIDGIPTFGIIEIKNGALVAYHTSLNGQKMSK